MNRYISKLADFIIKRYKLILLASILIFILSTLGAMQVGTKTDMASMLPKDSKVLKAQEEFDKYFESQENVLIVIQGNSNECEQFIEELSEYIEKRNIATNILYKTYYEELEPYSLLYLDIDNYRNLNNLKPVEKSPYIISESKDTYLMIIKPNIDYSNIMNSLDSFFNGLEEAIAINKDKYEGIEAGYTGGAFVQDYQGDQEAFNSLFSTAIIAFGLIMLFIVLSFRRVLLPLAAGYPLLLGVIMTTMVTWLIYGNMNMFSISFAALLFGLGIDFAVHIINRYLEERSKGIEVKEAMKNTIKDTGGSILIGAITTSAAFLAFVFAEFKAFTQMGVISGVGILLLCLVMMIIVPSLVLSLDSKKSKEKKIVDTSFKFLKIVGKVTSKYSIYFVVTVVLIGILLFNNVSNSTVSGNISELYPKEMECLKWLKVVEEEFGYSPNTLNFMVDNKRELLEVVDTLSAREDVKTLESIYDYLPKNQEEKIEVLKNMGIVVEPLTIEKMPQDIRKNFVGKDGKLLIELVPNTNIWETNNYNNLKDAISNVADTIPVGMPAIMNEVVEYVKRDVMAISMGCLVVVLIFLIVAFKSFKKAIITLVPVILSLYFLLGVLPILSISLSIFSVIAFPIIIGIGIDSGVHMMHRLSTGDEPIEDSIMYTGKAVMMTTITTLIGFGSIAFSNHPGISGLGITVMLGMGLCLIFTIIILPSLYKLTNI